MKKVLIVGGGVGGLSLALALKSQGIKATVYEKYPRHQLHPTGHLIWSYAVRILQKLEVPIEEAGTPLEIFEVHGRSGAILSEMPIGKISREYGADSYEINRSILIQKMWGMVGADLRLGQECVRVESLAEGARITLADGTTDSGDMVIGCDGAHSLVRGFVDEKAELKMLGAMAWVAVIDSHPPALKANRHMDFWQPGSKAGVADVGRGQSRWYTTFTRREADPKRSKKEQIREGLDPVPQAIAQCLEMTREEQLIPVRHGDLLGLKLWHKGQVLMLGDAAHATSPFAGMGACAAIADADKLADLISAGGEIKEMFQKFQEQRKPAADAVILESRHNLEMSTCRSRLKTWIRDWGLSHIPEQKMHEIVSAMVRGQ